jgi:flagellar hook assembly protein FlgD
MVAFKQPNSLRSILVRVATSKPSTASHSCVDKHCKYCRHMQKEKQRSTKHIYKGKGQVTRVPRKTGVNSGAPEWSVDPDPLVAPVVVI